MKKRYISPFVEIVDVAVTPLMTTTSPITSPEDEEGGGRGNDTDQSSEFRGDWSNIWEKM